MRLTENSEVFGALHEDGINLLVRHVMRQRPSLFNYGTRFILDNHVLNPSLLCAEIEASDMVRKYDNPLLGVIDPLGVAPIGEHLALNWLLQITDLELDFHPPDSVSLPPQLTPLAAQHFAVRARVCGGIGCPEQAFIDGFEVPEQVDEDAEPVVPDVDELLCFCLEAFAVGGFAPVEDGDSLQTMLRPVIDGVHIDRLDPADLESAIACYLRLSAQFGLARELSDVLADVIPGILEDLDEELGLTLTPAPIAGAIDFNPAIRDSELRLFVNIEEVDP